MNVVPVRVGSASRARHLEHDPRLVSSQRKWANFCGTVGLWVLERGQGDLRNVPKLDVLGTRTGAEKENPTVPIKQGLKCCRHIMISAWCPECQSAGIHPSADHLNRKRTGSEDWVHGSMSQDLSCFCFFLWRLTKVILRGQNQDALRSALWGPATSQNLAGSKPPKSPRSVFRHFFPRATTQVPWNPVFDTRFKCVSQTLNGRFKFGLFRCGRLEAWCRFSWDET